MVLGLLALLGLALSLPEGRAVIATMGVFFAFCTGIHLISKY
jgi:hypothetical protein